MPLLPDLKDNDATILAAKYSLLRKLQARNIPADLDEGLLRLIEKLDSAGFSAGIGPRVKRIWGDNNFFCQKTGQQRSSLGESLSVRQPGWTPRCHVRRQVVLLPPKRRDRSFSR